MYYIALSYFCHAKTKPNRKSKLQPRLDQPGLDKVATEGS